MLYQVTIKSIVPEEERHELDIQEFDDGANWEYETFDEESALELFHWEVPVKVLDHYEITCMQIGEEPAQEQDPLIEALKYIVMLCGEDDLDMELKELCKVRWAIKDIALDAIKESNNK